MKEIPMNEIQLLDCVDVKDKKLKGIVLSINTKDQTALIMEWGGIYSERKISDLTKDDKSSAAPENFIPRPLPEQWDQLAKAGHMEIEKLIYRNTVAMNGLAQKYYLLISKLYKIVAAMTKQTGIKLDLNLFDDGEEDDN